MNHKLRGHFTNFGGFSNTKYVTYFSVLHLFGAPYSKEILESARPGLEEFSGRPGPEEFWAKSTWPGAKWPRVQTFATPI